MTATNRAAIALSLITTVGLLGACSRERLLTLHAEEGSVAFWLTNELVACGVLLETGAGLLIVAEAA
jgi:hypothetical protein